MARTGTLWREEEIMRSPQYGAHVEVTEKRGHFLDCHFARVSCFLAFTTCEQSMKARNQIIKLGEHGRFCTRNPVTLLGDYPPSIDFLSTTRPNPCFAPAVIGRRAAYKSSGAAGRRRVAA
jgi:hypothetical protein